MANFDIQRFGDNDIVTSSREGNLLVKFYDGDTRTLKIDNPKSDLNATVLNNFVSNILVATQPVVGDKTGASIVSAEYFKIIEKTDRKLDLT